jgi:hypothetical protein
MDMKPLSDKEFDKFFQEKLSAYEEMPSKAVWSGISNQLNNKKKRSFPVIWMAAASLAAVIGAGAWFSAQKEPMYLHGNVDPVVVNQDKKIEQSVEIVKQIDQKTNNAVSRPKVINHTSISVNNVAVIKEEKSLTTLPVREKVATKQQPIKVINAAIPEPVAEEETKVILPDEALALAEKTEEDIENVDLKPKRIKSVGGLVNFVVAKVDKRKKKIIEFEDSDEGTKVSGLNLVLFKFQSKE